MLVDTSKIKAFPKISIIQPYMCKVSHKIGYFGFTRVEYASKCSASPESTKLALSKDHMQGIQSYNNGTDRKI
jgi:hypothetical protein